MQNIRGNIHKMKRYFSFILASLFLFVTLPVSAEEKEERKWQDETIYYLMVDRFNNNDFSNDFDVDANDPNRYHGGDFQGIIDRLDYIKEMGFTVVELSPIFDNEDDGYHGYWVKDPYNTEEHFGTLDKFKELVKEAHNRDMKLIIDFVTPESLEENTDIIDAAVWWIQETDIDGYRLDQADQHPVEFWREFTTAVKQVKEDLYLLGDIKSNDSKIIKKYAEAGFDGFADYPLNEALKASFEQPDQSFLPLFTSLEKNENDYLTGIFMDNQHTVRFTRYPISQNLHPGPRWKLALTYLYTTPGIPIVYYGSEIALDGGEEPDNQRQMDFRTDKELVEYITSIGKLRGQLPSLTRGTFDVLHEEDGFAIYKRQYEDETTVIALNNSTESKSVSLSSSHLEQNKELRGLLAGDLVRSENGAYTIILDRDEAEIYMLAEETGLNLSFIIAIIVVVVAFILFLILLKRRSKRNPA